MLLAAFMIANLFGCSLVPVSTPVPTATPTPVPMTVRQLIDSEESFVGHPVTMTGTVIVECCAG